MERLSGKVAIVTGASSGFGEMMAERFAAEGADLALGARRGDRLDQLAARLREAHSRNVVSCPLDVREPGDVDRFVKISLNELGPADILVNSAGLALGREPLATAEEEDWQQMFDTNVMGVFRMTKAVLKQMLPRRQGHVVNIGSIAGHYTYEGGTGYCGSKFALGAVTKALRSELVESGIRVSSVDPGLAETEFSLVRFKGDDKVAKAVYRGMDPLTAQDVAECVLFVVTRPPPCKHRRHPRHTPSPRRRSQSSSQVVSNLAMSIGFEPGFATLRS